MVGSVRALEGICHSGERRFPTSTSQSGDRETRKDCFPDIPLKKYIGTQLRGTFFLERYIAIPAWEKGGKDLLIKIAPVARNDPN
jgi:hypothetical protein